MSPNTRSKSRKRKTSKPLILQPPQDPTPSEFSTAIARTAVAQICHSTGFNVTQLSALETLTRVAVQYLKAIAAASASYSAKAGRTDSNLFDVASALHDLHSAQGGFPGASELHKRCVLGSGVLRDLAAFVERGEEIPFAWPIPRREKTAAESEIVGESDSGINVKCHVPKWLPKFPEVGAEAKKKRRNGEELWEEMCVGNGNGNGNDKCGDDESKVEELGVMSEGKVRFRIGGVVEKSGGGACLGVKMRNGICRGGKRVLEWKRLEFEKM